MYDKAQRNNAVPQESPNSFFPGNSRIRHQHPNVNRQPRYNCRLYSCSADQGSTLQSHCKARYKGNPFRFHSRKNYTKLRFGSSTTAEFSPKPEPHPLPVSHRHIPRRLYGKAYYDAYQEQAATQIFRVHCVQARRRKQNHSTGRDAYIPYTEPSTDALSDHNPIRLLLQHRIFRLYSHRNNGKARNPDHSVLLSVGFWEFPRPELNHKAIQNFQHIFPHSARLFFSHP